MFEGGVLRLLPSDIILSGVIVRFKDFHAFLPGVKLYTLKKAQKKLRGIKKSRPRKLKKLKEVDFKPIRSIKGNGLAIADAITRLNIKAGFSIPALPKKTL